MKVYSYNINYIKELLKLNKKLKHFKIICSFTVIKLII
jgi:hypothetical protein